MLILANHIEESRAEPLTSVDDEDSEVVLQVLESVFNLVTCDLFSASKTQFTFKINVYLGYLSLFIQLA